MTGDVDGLEAVVLVEVLAVVLAEALAGLTKLVLLEMRGVAVVTALQLLDEVVAVALVEETVNPDIVQQLECRLEDEFEWLVEGRLVE